MLVKEETIQVYCEGCEKSGPYFEIISFLLICTQVLGRLEGGVDQNRNSWLVVYIS